MPNYFALIPAAGSGSRMEQSLPKQYLSLHEKPMIFHSLNVLCQNQFISKVIVVLAPKDKHWFTYDWSEFNDKLLVFTCGGATRADSVRNGLLAAKQDNLVNTQDWILVHDAARPCLTASQLNKLLHELAGGETGGLLAVPVADTLKRANSENRVTATEPREHLWQAQTPQMFRYEILIQALQNTANKPITDDASAVELMGLSPKLIMSDTQNFKVTYPQDLALAELILQNRKTHD